MTDDPATWPPRAGWITHGLDAFAYALAVLSIFPAGLMLVALLATVGFQATGRQVFWPPTNLACLLAYIPTTASLAGIVIAISLRRRSTSRVAAASVRLAILGLAVVGLDAAIMGALAWYPF